MSTAEALERFASLPARDLVFARVDAHRELRQGAPEAVLADGKTPDQVVAIVAALLGAGASSVLVTRASEDVRKAVSDGSARCARTMSARGRSGSSGRCQIAAGS